VGCPSDGACAAEGVYTQATGARALVLYSAAGTAWQANGETLPNLASTGGITSTGVSCSPDGYCAAAGYFQTATGISLPFVFTIGDQFSGTVTQADGTPLGGVQLDLTGTDSLTGQPVSKQTSSAADGSYAFAVDAGSYTVTPAQPASSTDERLLDTSCSGTTAP